MKTYRRTGVSGRWKYQCFAAIRGQTYVKGCIWKLGNPKGWAVPLTNILPLSPKFILQHMLCSNGQNAFKASYTEKNVELFSRGCERYIARGRGSLAVASC